MAGAGWPTDAGAALLVELDGPEAECEARFDEVTEICERHGSDDVRVARDEAERDADLEDAQGRVRGDGPSVAALLRAGRRHPAHASCPRCSTASTSSPASTTCASPTSSTPATATCTRSSATTAKAGEAERAEELAGEIVEACVEVGGSITGEHGVGVDKKRYMPKMFTEPDLAAFQKLRCAFDPDGPGEPRQGHADAAAVRRGARAPTASTRSSGRASRSGSTWPADDARQRPPRRPPRVLRGRRRRCASPRGGGRRSAGATAAPSAAELSLAGLDAIVEHNEGDLTAVAPGGRAAGHGAARRSRAPARCSRSTRPTTARRSAASSPPADSGPLRHRYGAARDLVLGVAVALPDGSVARAGGEGHQERRRLRPRQALRRLVRHARRDLRGRRPPAPRPPTSRDGRIRADDPAALAARRARARPPAARGRGARRRAGTAAAARCSPASPGPPAPQARRAARSTAGEVAGRRRRAAWAAQRAAQRGRRCVVRVSTTQTGLRAVLGLAARARRHARRPRRARPLLAAPRAGRRGRRVERDPRGAARRALRACSTRPRTLRRPSTRGTRPAPRERAHAPRQGALRPAGHLQPRPHVRSISDPVAPRFDDRNPPEPDLHRRLRALRLLPADVPDVRAVGRGDGLAARAHRADARRATRRTAR